MSGRVIIIQCFRELRAVNNNSNRQTECISKLEGDMDAVEKDLEPKDNTAKEKDGIKCRYMKASKEFLSNTTFHGISWVAEDVTRTVKVS